jgi:hypothetical protein
MLNTMALQIRNEATQSLNKMLGSECEPIYISWSCMVDELCMRRLSELETMEDEHHNVRFPGLRALLSKHDYSIKEMIDVLKMQNTNTDVGEVIQALDETWATLPLSEVFKRTLPHHGFVLNQNPITIESVMARVEWQLHNYPAWIDVLLINAHHGPQVKKILDNLESTRSKINLNTTPLLLPFGMHNEAKRDHGKFLHKKPKALMGKVDALAKEQRRALRDLEYRWSECCDASVREKKMNRWVDQIQAMGLQPQDVEDVLHHMTKRSHGEDNEEVCHRPKRSCFK